MEEDVAGKLAKLKLLAKRDYQYKKLEKKCKWLEMEFSDIVRSLPQEQEDIVWDFVMSSNELDRMLLEIAGRFLEETQLEL